MKFTVEQIKDHFNLTRCYDGTRIFRGHDKRYIQMFGHTWILNSVDERYSRAEFYNKELNAALVGNLNRFRKDMVTVLYVKQL